MKKIAKKEDRFNYIFHVFDSTDYIILEKDNQRISDKYVDFDGNKYNEYPNLEKNSIIIRNIYMLEFFSDGLTIYFRNFKNYKYYEPSGSFDKMMIDSSLNNKNSAMNFYYKKDLIENVFSKVIEINVE